MKLSIVIPTKDKLSRLKLTLQALEAQMDANSEVVIVFDGCEPSMVEQFALIPFSFTPVTVVCARNVGRAAARNLGVKHASGDIIVFLDDDRVPADDFIRKHREGHRTPCVLLGGRQDSLVSEFEIEALFRHGKVSHTERILKEKLTDGELHKPMPIRLNSRFNWLLFYTGNVSLEKRHFEQAGGFDEQFQGWGHEDLDLGIRLSLIGVPFSRDNSITAYHLLHDSSFNIAERTKQSLKNLKYMMGKYKYSLVYWVLTLFYIKIRLVGMQINQSLIKEKKAGLSK
ncbi:glycosyltransferase [Paenibacillus athensensis]|nr:glycosyltransferase [Paenibacillus athensensis]MCD1258461.1 glycosyltransferase [Paenibacillus athensensis]